MVGWLNSRSVGPVSQIFLNLTIEMLIQREATGQQSLPRTQFPGDLPFQTILRE